MYIHTHTHTKSPQLLCFLGILQKKIAINASIIFNTCNNHILIFLDPLKSLVKTFLNSVSACLNTTYMFIIINN